jgi:hypothetical protein
MTGEWTVPGIFQVISFLMTHAIGAMKSAKAIRHATSSP